MTPSNLARCDQPSARDEGVCGGVTCLAAATDPRVDEWRASVRFLQIITYNVDTPLQKPFPQ